MGHRTGRSSKVLIIMAALALTLAPMASASAAKTGPLRTFMRGRNLDQLVDNEVLEQAGLTEAAAVRLYRLFTIGGYDERNVIPAQQREEQDPYARKGASGFGILKRAGRGK